MNHKQNIYSSLKLMTGLVLVLEFLGGIYLLCTKSQTLIGLNIFEYMGLFAVTICADMQFSINAIESELMADPSQIEKFEGTIKLYTMLRNLSAFALVMFALGTSLKP